MMDFCNGGSDPPLQNGGSLDEGVGEEDDDGGAGGEGGAEDDLLVARLLRQRRCEFSGDDLAAVDPDAAGAPVARDAEAPGFAGRREKPKNIRKSKGVECARERHSDLRSGANT